MMSSSAWSERVLARSASRDGDHRTAFQRDKARVMHSAAFRRLQAKTQVLGIGISDFYRTRLTHSLEAAQIGTGIASQLEQKYPELSARLGIDQHLIETLCLAHDIGHPPFGHGGEIALHYMMRNHGGFEGNGQTFRIITSLEAYSAENGMNLARRTLLGLVKYPNYINKLHKEFSEPGPMFPIKQVKAAEWHPPKGLFDCDLANFEWVISPFSNTDKHHFQQIIGSVDQHGKTQHKSFDCSVMELADDIAYAIHDLEDAIVMNMVSKTLFVDEIERVLTGMQVPWLSNNIESLTLKLFSEHPFERKNAIGALVNCFITSIKIKQSDIFEHDLLSFNAVFEPPHHEALALFKAFIMQHVILKPELQLLEYKGQQIVMGLFEAFSLEPERLLPTNTKKRFVYAEDENARMRIIADYISGMTDEYATRLYNHLFLPKSGGISDSLTP